MSTNQPPKRPIRILPTLIITAVAITAGIWAANALLHAPTAVDELAATRFPVARPLQPFHLVDHQGTTFDNRSLQGYWSFLFFGYTNCPDVCPATLSVLNSVAQKLGDLSTPLHFVFITVDPQRDTPEKLASFITYFNQQFMGVTGNSKELDVLTKQLGILHMQVVNESDQESYLIDHTAGIFLIDPAGNYHAIFTPPLSAEVIAGDFRKILEVYR
jgi:protein SCO1/2